MARIGFDPATASHTVPKFTVGAKYWQGAKAYYYVLNSGAATAATEVVRWTGTEGSVDRAGSSNAPIAGVCPGPIGASEYGFVQCEGYASIKASGTLALSDGIVMSGTAATASKASAATDLQPVAGGWLGAVSSGVAPGWLNC